MPYDLALAHVFFIVLMIVLLGMEEDDEHGRPHR